MHKENLGNFYKLRYEKINYKVNEKKGAVTAIITVILPYQLSTTDYFQFEAIGVAKVNKEAERFNLEVGKKVARAKAEKEAFIELKRVALDFKRRTYNHLQEIDNTITKMNSYIKHQKEYIKTF